MRPLRCLAAASALAAIAWLPVTASAMTDTSDTTDTSAPPHTHEVAAGDAMEFGPAPDHLPAGAEIAVLHGDPLAEGDLFSIRLRFPDGYVIPPHWHPTDEHVTVISGTFQVGLGDTFDEAALMTLEAGGFITAPANANHYAKAVGPTEIQLHALGPFEITYVDPGDDPRNG